MRGLALALLLLSSAGCDRSLVSENEGVTTNQIERLSQPHDGEPDPAAALRLDPITRADIAQAGLLGAGCDFSRNGRTLLAAVQADAIARVGGTLRHFVQTAPVGPTGGFFEDRLISVSIGRTDEAGTSAGETGAWPARITITNRRTQLQRELEGTWTCGA